MNKKCIFLKFKNKTTKERKSKLINHRVKKIPKEHINPKFYHYFLFILFVLVSCLSILKMSIFDFSGFLNV